MQIKEITIDEFNEFAKECEYNNFRQSLPYALLKCEAGYEYEIIGYGDNEKLYAAAIVLVKMIRDYLYAYIPNGFLIDYKNIELVESFTKQLIKYYEKDNIAFIKVNPPVVIGEIDKNTYTTNYNINSHLSAKMQKMGYSKLNNNLNFESSLPRFDGVIDLDNYSIQDLSKNTKNKVRKGVRKGLKIELCQGNKINVLNDIIGTKITNNYYYYNDYFNIFNKYDAIDYFLVTIDYDTFMSNAQKAYETELKRNETLNKIIQKNPSTKNINIKMNSDRVLLTYKEDISRASKLLNSDKKYIAGALVVKHGDSANIVISGYDKNFKEYVPNYYLYFEIIKHYIGKYKHLYLNGMSGDLKSDSKYHGLNRFKLGFNPHLYEYIGEFDLIINHKEYNYMLKKGILAEEFNK